MYHGDLVRVISCVAPQKDRRLHVDNLTGILDRVVGSSLRRRVSIVVVPVLALVGLVN